VRASRNSNTMIQKHDTPVLLHLHIPKTAGMTLNDIVLAMLGDSEWSEREEGRFVNGVYYPRAGIDGHFLPDAEARRILSREDLRAALGQFSFCQHEDVN